MFWGFVIMFFPKQNRRKYTSFKYANTFFEQILYIVLARETKTMYNIILLNFTMWLIYDFTFKCNYHVYKFYPGCAKFYLQLHICTIFVYICVYKA